MSKQKRNQFVRNQIHASTEFGIFDFDNQPSSFIHTPRFPRYNELVDKNQFQMSVNPRMECEHQQSSCVYLRFGYFLQSKNTNAFIRYRVSVVNAKGEKRYTKEYHWKFESSRPHEPIAFFISRTDAQRFLFSKKLQIHCEVDVLNDFLRNLAASAVDAAPPSGTESTSTENTEDPNTSPGPHSDFDVTDALQSLLDSGKFSDFTAVVGGREFAVHKNILAVRSEVFAAMFEHETKESQENRVVIEDLSEEVFELLLRYIYTGKVRDLGDFVPDLFTAADKYQLQHLKSFCEQSLTSSISIKSAAEILVLADMHNVAELRSKCMEYIVGNSTEVMATEGWKHIKSRLDLMAELFESMATKVKK